MRGLVKEVHEREAFLGAQLQHEHGDQVLGGVEPDLRACRAAPAEFSDGGEQGRFAKAPDDRDAQAEGEGLAVDVDGRMAGGEVIGGHESGFVGP